MYSLRNVSAADAALLKHLAGKCYPLDVHTPYTYWVVANYHAISSYILQNDKEPIGFITALNTPNMVFVWQIGILEEFRRKGLSKMLISAVFDYARSVSKDIEVTIAADNDASKSAFASVCKKQNVKMVEIGVVELRDIDDDSFTEVEKKYRISFDSASI